MKKSLSSIKYYFAVDQNYVMKKLCLLLFPFRPRVNIERDRLIQDITALLELVIDLQRRRARTTTRRHECT